MFFVQFCLLFHPQSTSDNFFSFYSETRQGSILLVTNIPIRCLTSLQVSLSHGVSTHTLLHRTFLLAESADKRYKVSGLCVNERNSKCTTFSKWHLYPLNWYHFCT
jgi:hypothetical protein